MSIADNMKNLRQLKNWWKQERFIALLNDKNKSAVMNIFDTMVTNQKFQIFFEKNIQTTK
jgi:hypothetical protein